ncbi:MAG: ECF-type sigma factor [Myxococcota bacterium]
MADDIGSLLEAVRRGDERALDLLFSSVYDELRRLAQRSRRRHSGHITLTTTALVHEAYIKLASGKPGTWKTRSHFFATAAKVFRHVLANYAERRSAAKRGGRARPLPFDELLFMTDPQIVEAVAIHQALDRLDVEDPRMSRVVECRVFGGMSVSETAEALGVSEATVKRDWQVGAAWLYTQLRTNSYEIHHG